MKAFITLAFGIIFLYSCSNNTGSSGSVSNSLNLTDENYQIVKEVPFNELKLLIKDYHFFHRNSSFMVDTSFELKSKKGSCRGITTTHLTLEPAKRKIIVNFTKKNIQGICQEKTKNQKFSKKGDLLIFFSYLAFEKGLGPDFKIQEVLWKNEKAYLAYFANQNFDRSYLFKINKDKKTIKFPVIVKYSYHEGQDKILMKSRVSVQQKEQDHSTLPEDLIFKNNNVIDIVESLVFEFF